jgi:uncharacterized membrane protein
MFDRGKTTVLKERAAADLAAQLAGDKKFRKHVLAAADHAIRANRRVWRQVGLLALVGRLAADQQLRTDVAQMARDLQAAWEQAKHHRRHRLRTTLLVLAGAGAAGGAAAAAARPQARRWLSSQGRRLSPGGLAGGRVVDASIEVEVPVATAYNQWTQFEEFPEFMEGVEEVRQLDDTRLRWVASIGGKRAEWDAKILEQHPDRQISWISEDGKKTRGTVSFEKLGDGRTLIRLSMSYRAEGVREVVGSALGVDSKRVRGDLERFKQLIEDRDEPSGAWRGDIAAGTSAKATTPDRQA